MKIRMKEVEYDHNGAMHYWCTTWFTRLGLYETEWILNRDTYNWCKNNGHAWTYKEVVLEQKGRRR